MDLMLHVPGRRMTTEVAEKLDHLEQVKALILFDLPTLGRRDLSITPENVCFYVSSLRKSVASYLGQLRRI